MALILFIASLVGLYGALIVMCIGMYNNDELVSGIGLVCMLVMFIAAIITSIKLIIESKRKKQAARDETLLLHQQYSANASDVIEFLQSHPDEKSIIDDFKKYNHFYSISPNKIDAKVLVSHPSIIVMLESKDAFVIYTKNMVFVYGVHNESSMVFHQQYMKSFTHKLVAITDIAYETTTYKRNVSVTGRAITGGIIGGAPGAIIGAVSARDTNSRGGKTYTTSTSYDSGRCTLQLVNVDFLNLNSQVTKVHINNSIYGTNYLNFGVDYITQRLTTRIDDTINEYGADNTIHTYRRASYESQAELKFSQKEANELINHCQSICLHTKKYAE